MNRENAFTPGPWVAHDEWDRVDGELKLVGPLPGSPVVALTSYHGPEGRAANARLIAAAPDLLAVVQQCADLAEKWGEQGPLVRAARAALAKATAPLTQGAE